MPAHRALTGPASPPTTHRRNRHIVTTIVIAAYALLLISGLGLAIIQPRPPSTSSPSSHSAPHATTSQSQHRVGQAADLASETPWGTR